MRAIGFVVSCCLALGLVQGAAAEPPASESNRTGVRTTGSALGSGAPRSRHETATDRNRARTSTVASAAPKITTDSAYATGATTAIVTGNGDPEGQPTRLHAKYARSDARWCTSHGAKGKSARTRSQKLGSGYEMISELSVTLEGLTAGTEYCVELVATNRSGTSYGGQVRFTTSAADTQGGAQGSRTPPPPLRRGPSQFPPATAHSSWSPTATIVVAVLATVLLGGLLLVTYARLRPRRHDSTRPAAS